MAEQILGHERLCVCLKPLDRRADSICDKVARIPERFGAREGGGHAHNQVMAEEGKREASQHLGQAVGTFHPKACVKDAADVRLGNPHQHSLPASAVAGRDPVVSCRKNHAFAISVATTYAPTITATTAISSSTDSGTKPKSALAPPRNGMAKVASRHSQDRPKKQATASAAEGGFAGAQDQHHRQLGQERDHEPRGLEQRLAWKTYSNTPKVSRSKIELSRDAVVPVEPFHPFGGKAGWVMPEAWLASASFECQAEHFIEYGPQDTGGVHHTISSRVASSSMGTSSPWTRNRP